jgi:hypothetical protein
MVVIEHVVIRTTSRGAAMPGVGSVSSAFNQLVTQSRPTTPQEPRTSSASPNRIIDVGDLPDGIIDVGDLPDGIIDVGDLPDGLAGSRINRLA